MEGEEISFRESEMILRDERERSKREGGEREMEGERDNSQEIREGERENSQREKERPENRRCSSFCNSCTIAPASYPPSRLAYR